MEKNNIYFGLLHLEWTNALFVLTVFSVLVFLLHFFCFRTVLNREKNQGSSEKEILQLQAEKEQTIQKKHKIKNNQRSKKILVSQSSLEY